ncbi:hypothetical protein LJC08_02415 [Methanimicrococcus sp. OttesenSCG-928-J09]|nr:hypothetical protein [Methanimicrococcus sp. OttesenSCG-928-J09]
MSARANALVFLINEDWCQVTVAAWSQAAVAAWSQAAVATWSQIPFCSGKEAFVKNRFAIFAAAAAQ